MAAIKGQICDYGFKSVPDISVAPGPGLTPSKLILTGNNSNVYATGSLDLKLDGATVMGRQRISGLLQQMIRPPEVCWMPMVRLIARSPDENDLESTSGGYWIGTIIGSVYPKQSWLLTACNVVLPR